MKQNMKRWLVSGIAIAAMATSILTHAGSVTAVAGSTTTTNTGSTASATEDALFATTTRVTGSVTGTINNFVLGAFPNVRTETTSEFEVFGLAAPTPLTFHWSFFGDRRLTPNNSFISASFGTDLRGPGFIDTIGWGISYGEAFGSAAGSLTGSFAEAAAGVGYSNNLPPNPWNGLGTRFGSSTYLSAMTGTTGSFGLTASTNISGDTFSSYRISLESVTAPSGTNVSGAFLLLDSGGQIAILAAPVPEPSTYALMLAGLGFVGFVARRKRKARAIA